MLPSARTERLQCKVAVKGMEVCVGRGILLYLGVMWSLCSVTQAEKVQYSKDSPGS